MAIFEAIIFGTTKDLDPSKITWVLDIHAHVQPLTSRMKYLAIFHTASSPIAQCMWLRIFLQVGGKYLVRGVLLI